MPSDLTQLDLLSTNLYQLKNLKTMDEKCSYLLDTLRKAGWGKVSLSFLNSKYETRKTLYSGYEPEAIKISEEHKLAPEKRKELLSSTVDRWRIVPFYYLPWRDERARYIVSGGLSTEIPLKYKVEWHKNDLLYAPIYHEGRPVAVLTLDSPREQTIPTKVSLRVPTIIHSMLTEVILQNTLTEHYDNFLEIYNSVIAQGTIGIIEFDESGRITVVNDVAEQILTINRIKLIGNNYYKVLSNDLIAKLSPAIQKAAETLKSVNVITEYTDIDQITKAIDIQITPLHILFNYTGMVWSLNYIEKTAIFKTYRTVLDNFKNINSRLSGDYINIQKQLVKLMCDQYGFRYPRLYILSEDHENLKCVLSYDSQIEDLEFFDHPYNRNSLAANAILENEIVFSSEKEQIVRDLRRIWERLKTKAAIAIPLHILPEVKAALVFDIQEKDFFIDESRKLSLDLFSNLISLVLRPLFEKNNK